MWSRKILMYAASGLFALSILPVVGEWSIELARAKGLYNDPEGVLALVQSYLAGIVSSALYWPVVYIILGVLLGVLAYWIAGRFDQRVLSNEDTTNTLQLMDAPNTDALQIISNKEFKSERFLIDGKHLINCSFEDCEIHYNGGDYTIENLTVVGKGNTVNSTVRAVSGAVSLIGLLGMTHPDLHRTMITPMEKGD